MKQVNTTDCDTVEAVYHWARRPKPKSKPTEQKTKTITMTLHDGIDTEQSSRIFCWERLASVALMQKETIINENTLYATQKMPNEASESLII